eukprot:INCI13571.1.p2 GENE.INCI13571.1~~INCI13571.1.p2  ORF type:complete len:126 (+),score=27.62 INCI13571.1:1499-1876(+)
MNGSVVPRYFYVVDGAVKTTDAWLRDGPPMQDRDLARAVVERGVQKKKLTESCLTSANAVPVNAEALKKRKLSNPVASTSSESGKAENKLKAEATDSKSSGSASAKTAALSTEAAPAKVPRKSAS